MKRPPFGDNHWPVKNEPSSEARKSGRGGDSRASAGASERCAGEHRLLDQGRDRLGHRRVDVARTDRVHPDPARGDVARHRPREGEDPAFAAL